MNKSRLRRLIVAVPAGYIDYAFIHKYVGKEDRQYIEFAQLFTEGVEMIMTRNEPSNVLREIMALQAEINAAKEVWEECGHFHSQWEKY
jgi:hypothetical protein